MESYWDLSSLRKECRRFKSVSPTHHTKYYVVRRLEQGSVALRIWE